MKLFNIKDTLGQLNQISDNMYEDPSTGYLHCKNVIMGRTGIQKYKGFELGFTGDLENKIIDIERPAEEVFNKDSLASLEDKAFTIDHPGENVDITNDTQLRKGTCKNIREEDNVIKGDIIVYDAETIEMIKSKERREVSLGYTIELEKVNDTHYIARDIRYNHCALVYKGRAGVAKILDALLYNKNNLKGGHMSKNKKSLLDRIFNRPISDDAYNQLINDSDYDNNETERKVDSDVENAENTAEDNKKETETQDSENEDKPKVEDTSESEVEDNSESKPESKDKSDTEDEENGKGSEKEEKSETEDESESDNDESKEKTEDNKKTDDSKSEKKKEDKDKEDRKDADNETEQINDTAENNSESENLETDTKEESVENSKKEIKDMKFTIEDIKKLPDSKEKTELLNKMKDSQDDYEGITGNENKSIKDANVNIADSARKVERERANFYDSFNPHTNKNFTKNAYTKDELRKHLESFEFDKDKASKLF